MQIFDQEKLDGLAPQMKNSVIAYSTAVSPTRKFDVDPEIRKFHEAKGSNPDQLDLFYLDCILATVGWNKNDDIFDAAEMWAAKSSPIDKQFNFMHNETDIIGHITASKAVDFDNKEIVSSEVPDKFHIVASSVLYTHWSDEELQERMDNIIAEINSGKWYVSMECLFSQFDYGVISPDGQHRVIARQDDTAFLTKHLRVYGGSGEFKGNKIGRLLRGFTFSGKGLVDNPANPDSIIFNATKYFSGAKASIGETNMSDDAKRIGELEAELKSAKAALDTTKAEKNELFTKVSELSLVNQGEVVAKLEAARTETEARLTEALDKAKVLAGEVEEKEAALAKLTADNKAQEDAFAELEARLAQIELDSAKAARKSDLVGAGLEEEAAAALVDKFVSSSDEVFAELVSAYQLKAKFDFKKDVLDKKKKKDGDKEDKEDKEDSKADVVIEDEDVEKTEAGLRAQEEEQVDLQKVRADVADFLTNSLSK
jgi:hypothetical protein